MGVRRRERARPLRAVAGRFCSASAVLPLALRSRVALSRRLTAAASLAIAPAHGLVLANLRSLQAPQAQLAVPPSPFKTNKQNPQSVEHLLALHQESFPLKGGIGLILNQGDILSPSTRYRRKVIHLLRHSQKVHREEDEAVHFWRIKENLQNRFPRSIHWSDDRWKVCLAAGGGAKRRFQYCTDDSGIIVDFRALQGHSGRNLIDLSLQDNVVIPSNFFQYIYHIGCAFNLHSIINSGFIPGGQNSSKRQTVFFLPVDPRDKSHKDLEKIDLNVPRHVQYLHNACKRHQDAIYWVDINLAIQKRLQFYQTRSNAIILQKTLPAYCISKVVRMKT